MTCGVGRGTEKPETRMRAVVAAVRQVGTRTRWLNTS